MRIDEFSVPHKSMESYSKFVSRILCYMSYGDAKATAEAIKKALNAQKNLEKKQEKE